jgi:hypothetical protein
MRPSRTKNLLPLGVAVVLAAVAVQVNAVFSDEKKDARSSATAVASGRNTASKVLADGSGLAGEWAVAGEPGRPCGDGADEDTGTTKQQDMMGEAHD